LPDFPDISVIGAPIYLVAIAIEVQLVRRGRARGLYEGADAATSIAMGVGSVVVGALTAVLPIAVILQAWEWRVATVPISVATIALCFVVDDCRFYWWHRFAHRIRWVWANHVVHHSSEHFNLSTALRQPWAGAISGGFLVGLPLVLLGFNPALLAFVASINLFYQFWIHTEAVSTLPHWVEAVFNTPSHHRVHHGKNPRYLDANYGGTLIVWDRLFGTFVPEQAEETVIYGIVHRIDTHNPLRVATHEYVAIARDAVRSGLRPRQRLAYLFAPPGWSHDGSRSQSTELKAAYVAAQPEAAGAPGLPSAR
jgi:sterol desaturase/sphingolipid hydroxylase (fatty acid hydroxylase superfamily)